VADMKHDMAIKRYTFEQMDGLKSLTDWDRFIKRKDEDIDLTDPDAPELTESIAKGLANHIDTPEWLKKEQQKAKNTSQATDGIRLR
jgi:hypothetical protein